MGGPEQGKGKGLNVKYKIRAALFEAGHPDAIVHGTEDNPAIVMNGPHGVPPEITWKAFKIVNQLPGCFACWDTGHELINDACIYACTPYIVQDCGLTDEQRWSIVDG